MIFRQLFDYASYTYTYLIASRTGGEALIIDPVLGQVDHYVRLLHELDLKLVKAIDTHLHADHVTGLGALRDRTHCITVMGEQSAADVVSMRLTDGEVVDIEGLCLEAMYTPGHTDDSYCFRLENRLFTGDTLFIRGTGRTDFQHGDPRAQYDSLFNRILELPGDTFVYPGHDYKGDTVSTIAEERAHNPRLQVSSADEYADMMNRLNLPDPKMMDVAVPANRRIGMDQDEIERRRWSLAASEVAGMLEASDTVLVDIRDKSERRRDGVIPGSVHVPYSMVEESVGPGGLLHELHAATGKRLVFYCAFGERSAMAVSAAQAAGLSTACHLRGGIEAWREASRPLVAAGS